MRITTVATGICSLMVVGACAQAQYSSNTPLGTASTFNAFIFGNASTPFGDADGAVAVGGNWTSDGLSVGGHSASGNVTVNGVTTPNIDLYVAGNLNISSSISLNSSGNGYVDGTINKNGNSVNLNGGQLFNSGVSSAIFSTQQAYSDYQSAHLAALTGASIVMQTSNTWFLNAGDSTQYGNLKVYTVNGSQLGNYATLGFNGFTSNETIVINVLGDVKDFDVSANTPSNSQVIWNFTTVAAGGIGQTGTVNIDNVSINGSVLAPNATVNQKQNIQGNLIAENWNMDSASEIHFGSGNQFTGNLSTVSPQSVSGTPEPGPYALLAAFVGSAFLVRRRRRRSRAI